MPRLSPELLLRAHRQHPLLPLLLRECRDLPSARNELRWLRSHALAQFSNPRFKHEKQTAHSPETLGWRTRLRAMCQARAKGKPLQYILGDQPFGDLEILCREGVLIPRYVCFRLQARSLINWFFYLANSSQGLKQRHIRFAHLDLF